MLSPPLYPMAPSHPESFDQITCRADGQAELQSISLWPRWKCHPGSEHTLSDIFLPLVLERKVSQGLGASRCRRTLHLLACPTLCRNHPAALCLLFPSGGGTHRQASPGGGWLVGWQMRRKTPPLRKKVKKLEEVPKVDRVKERDFFLKNYGV